MPQSCLIVGAGLAGLTAAYYLSQQGHPVTVLDKGKGVGGRLASKTIAGARFDYGAQYFSAKSPEFQHLVQQLEQAKIVSAWRPNPSFSNDRYIGNHGMSSIAKQLAKGLQVHTTEKVILLQAIATGVRATTESGNTYEADQLVLTMPVPQSLALLTQSQLTLSSEVASALSAIDYEPCIALMVALRGPSQLPASGSVTLEHSAIAWIADNFKKGISPLPSVTIHANATFSRTHFDDPLEQTTQRLLAEAAPWLPEEVFSDYRIHRWRYSLAHQRHPAPYLLEHLPFAVYFAGDAFGEGNVEGAYLSGKAVAESIQKLP
ncbi:MAG: FAD-dependent oxidoreductase [Spirosomataceae bacterium]